MQLIHTRLLKRDNYPMIIAGNDKSMPNILKNYSDLCNSKLLVLTILPAAEFRQS